MPEWGGKNSKIAADGAQKMPQKKSEKPAPERGAKQPSEKPKQAQKKPETTAPPLPPQVIGAFLERGASAAFTRMLFGYGVFFVSTLSGRGTASSDILDILGLEESEKDVVFAVTSAERASAVMAALNDRLSGFSVGRGIAFRTALSAAPNLLVSAINMGTRPARPSAQEGKKVNEEKISYGLILLSVKQGYADEVMAAAKSAGARGGTLLRAHQTATDGTKSLFGSAFSEEREIIAILAPLDKRNAIMDSVNAEHGVRSEAGVVALALAVHDIAKLS